MVGSTGSTKVDAVVQQVAANTPEKLSGFALYSRFALAGAVCCSVTHGGLTPVDVYVLDFLLGSAQFGDSKRWRERSGRGNGSGR